MSYEIYLFKDDIELWNLQLDDKDLLAGMLAASMGIISDITDANYFCGSNADVSEYRIYDAVPEEKLAYKCIDLNDKKFGVWMNSGVPFRYSLFAFNNASFFQGVISMCDTFNVDFRNYMYDLPFDNTGEKFTLNGYVLGGRQLAVDAFDLDDVEEEEKDNENLIELLHKDY